MTKLGSGVTLVEIAQTLGFYANPILLSKLGSHPNLNKWSRCKFVGYVGPSKNTVEELEQWMDDLHWGFNMKSVQPMNTDAQTYGSAITLSMGDVWAYSGVTASPDSPVRTGDMRHYNTDAECPFLPVELYYMDPGVDDHKPTKIRLKWGMNQSLNAEINPYNNPNLGGDYHILLKKSGTTTGTSMVESAVTENFADMTSPLIEIGSAQTGTYQVCAAIVRGGGNHEVYPLPETYMSFDVKSQTEEEYTGLRLENQCSMTRSSTVGTLTVKLQIRNLTSEAITASATCYIYDSRWDGTDDSLVIWKKENYAVTVPANGVVTLYGKTDPDDFATTDQGTIRVEGVGPQEQYRPPIMAQCKVYNSAKSDVKITKTATILNS